MRPQPWTLYSVVALRHERNPAFRVQGSELRGLVCDGAAASFALRAKVQAGLQEE
jgi:hypothetical protein